MGLKKKTPLRPGRLVRKSLLVDEAKLSRARELLGTASDAETLRLALDHLLIRYSFRKRDEEE